VTAIGKNVFYKSRCTVDMPVDETIKKFMMIWNCKKMWLNLSLHFLWSSNYMGPALPHALRGWMKNSNKIVRTNPLWNFISFTNSSKHMELGLQLLVVVMNLFIISIITKPQRTQGPNPWSWISLRVKYFELNPETGVSSSPLPRGCS
jgi:hypothetical protein